MDATIINVECYVFVSKIQPKCVTRATIFRDRAHDVLPRRLLTIIWLCDTSQQGVDFSAGRPSSQHFQKATAHKDVSVPKPAKRVALLGVFARNDGLKFRIDPKPRRDFDHILVRKVIPIYFSIDRSCKIVGKSENCLVIPIIVKNCDCLLK